MTRGDFREHRGEILPQALLCLDLLTVEPYRPGQGKGGVIVGGQYGEGALRAGGKTVGYYSTAAASYGLQAGVQSFGYAMMFMTDNAIQYLKKSSGWEIGVGPSVVVVDEGMARSLTTTTAKDDVYAFIFSQQGLMAGLGIQGSKITQIHPDRMGRLMATT